MRRSSLAAALAVLVAGATVVPAARAQDTPVPQFAVALLPPSHAVPGGVVRWRITAYVTAERLTIRLARHSDALRLLHRGSRPPWALVDARPQWDFGPLDPATETQQHVRFRTAVARDARVGSRVCIGIRAIGANGSGATERREATGIDRMCAKVARR
jgi:hypothetical protein